MLYSSTLKYTAGSLRSCAFFESSAFLCRPREGVGSGRRGGGEFRGSHYVFRHRAGSDGFDSETGSDRPSKARTLANRH